MTWALSDSPNQFLAQEGWLGCPHCGRPANARLLLLDAQRRFLRGLVRDLEEKGLKESVGAAALAKALSDVQETIAEVEDDFYPRLAYTEERP